MVHASLPEAEQLTAIDVTARSRKTFATKGVSRVGSVWRLSIVVLAACIAAGTSACRADQPPAGTTTSAPSVSTPGQDARASAAEMALDAYRGMWTAYAKAGLTSNADEPDLAKFAADDALRTLRKGLAGYRSKKQVIKGDFGSSPSVANVSPGTNPTTVTITDCLDGTRFLVYKSSGGLADDKPGGRRSATAAVTNLGGQGWKVTNFGVQEVGTC